MEKVERKSNHQLSIDVKQSDRRTIEDSNDFTITFARRCIASEAIHIVLQTGHQTETFLLQRTPFQSIFRQKNRFFLISNQYLCISVFDHEADLRV